MGGVLVESGVDSALTALTAAVDELLGVDVELCADLELSEAWQSLEAQRNRLAAADLGIIAVASSRLDSAVFASRSVVTLMRERLRIGTVEAKVRTDAAVALTPRRLPTTGELVEPVCPAAANALAEGAIGVSAARVVVDTLGQLPDGISLEDEAIVTDLLVQTARECNVDQLRRSASTVLQRLDPDGRLRDLEYQANHRKLRLVRRGNGYRLDGELTLECGERLAPVLDALSAPKAAANGTADDRTADHRRHDALLELVTMVQRAKLIGDAGGVTVTVVLHLTDAAWATGRGAATTGSGAVLPAQEALAWTGGDTRVIGIVRNHLGAVEELSGSHRLATEKQRLALAARDGGCSFPNCDTPPPLCESHHVIDYEKVPWTSVNGLTLLCRYHHRAVDKYGWTCHITDGVPEWTPPPWLDREQKPLRNKAHRPLE